MRQGHRLASLLFIAPWERLSDGLDAKTRGARSLRGFQPRENPGAIIITKHQLEAGWLPSRFDDKSDGT